MKTKVFFHVNLYNLSSEWLIHYTLSIYILAHAGSVCNISPVCSYATESRSMENTSNMDNTEYGKHRITRNIYGIYTEYGKHRIWKTQSMINTEYGKQIINMDSIWWDNVPVWFHERTIALIRDDTFLFSLFTTKPRFGVILYSMSKRGLWSKMEITILNSLILLHLGAIAELAQFIINVRNSNARK